MHNDTKSRALSMFSMTLETIQNKNGIYLLNLFFFLFIFHLYIIQRLFPVSRALSFI